VIHFVIHRGLLRKIVRVVNQDRAVEGNAASELDRNRVINLGESDLARGKNLEPVRCDLLHALELAFGTVELAHRLPKLVQSSCRSAHESRDDLGEIGRKILIPRSLEGCDCVVDGFVFGLRHVRCSLGR